MNLNLEKELLLTDERIREIAGRWFPISEESLKYAYKDDIKEVARDFGYHLISDQLSAIKKKGYSIVKEK